jgi:hypothetical protein
MECGSAQIWTLLRGRGVVLPANSQQADSVYLF